MASYILAHDLGTTGDKATLFSAEGRLVESTFTPYPTYYPNTNWAEQNPEHYWEALCKTTKALITRVKITPGDIAVVSFSGQMMAALPVDKDGNALRNSIIWADLRSTKQVEEVSKRIDEATVYERTGHRLSASYSATKIMWIRENEPEIYAKTFKFIHAKDFLAARLTGNICTDYSDATGMNLLDIRSHQWCDDLLEATEIDKNKLPDPVESTEIVGTITNEAATRSGLLEGTPVVIGGGDGACATCGAGVVKEGQAYIYLGTSTWMALASNSPIVDPQKRTFTFNHFLKELYMPAGTMQAGGGSLKWFKDALCNAETAKARKSGSDVYDLLNERAKNIPCGSDGTIFLPYLMGERSPLWNPEARGCFIGLSIVDGKYHMLRSVLEGVAYNMKLIEEAFAQQGVKNTKIRIIGGGAKSPLWRQIFADIMEKTIVRLNFIEEATSIGAAIAGGVGAGLFSSIYDADRFVKIEEEVLPDQRNFRVYRKHYEVFKKSYEHLRDIFQMLSQGI